MCLHFDTYRKHQRSQNIYTNCITHTYTQMHTHKCIHTHAHIHTLSAKNKTISWNIISKLMHNNVYIISTFKPQKVCFCILNISNPLTFFHKMITFTLQQMRTSEIYMKMFIIHIYLHLTSRRSWSIYINPNIYQHNHSADKRMKWWFLTIV